MDLIWDYNLDVSPPELIPGSQIDFVELDPLHLGSASDSRYQIEEWEAQIEECHPELLDPFQLDLSPDYYHKADISGGAPYGVALPFKGADPVIENEAHNLPLVDYLRHCLRWAGFARLERHAEEPGVAELVGAMTKDFEPF